MNDQLKRLRDAVTGRDREIQVEPDGTVHEVNEKPVDEQPVEVRKATKLAPRTFGV